MANVSFPPAQKTVLQLLGHNLFAMPFTPEPDTDWSAVLEESKVQAVGTLAFQKYSELPLADEMAENIKKMIRASTMNNIRCLQYHTYLHKLMTANGISYCVVKGAASAHYYPDPLLRNMGDVDFFVPQGDIVRAEEVLKADGFEPWDHNHRYHVVFRKGKAHYEMHFRPIATPKGPVGDLFAEYWKNICEDSVLLRDGLTTCRIPDAFLHGFILLSHLQGHLITDGIGLRHVCDWLVFVNAFSDRDFVDIFREKLKKVGLWRLAQLLALAAVEHMGMPYREWMGDDRETASELLFDIVAGGNFGRKDKQRVQESFFVSGYGVDGVKSNRAVQTFRSLNRIVDSHWRAAAKFPLLYPIGWVWFSLRYLIRVLFGKRQLNFFGVYYKSGIRKTLYRKLRLFEPEQ